MYLKQGFGCLQMLMELTAMLFIVFGAYGRCRAVQTIRMILICFAGNVMLGGLFRILEEYEMGRRALTYAKNHSLLFTGVFFIFFYLVKFLYLLLSRQKQLTECEATVMLAIDGKEIYLKGFWDSGNFLRDALTGRPVVIANYDALKQVLSRRHQYILDHFFKEGCLDYDVMRKLNVTDIKTMRYESIGACDKKLPVIVADELCATLRGKKVQRRKQYIMLSEKKLFSEEGYDMLLHRDL